jgi:putative endonuclease
VTNIWYVYILECSDEKKSLYVGISNNLERRIKAHNSGNGAKFTRGRLPVTLLKSFKVDGKSQALKLEYKLKKLTREKKLNFFYKTGNN